MGGIAPLDECVAVLYVRGVAVAADTILAPNEYGSHPDPVKVAELAESMARSGWDGAPVLTMEGCGITGTHRIAAARLAGCSLPTLDLSDLTDETSVDIAARVHAATGLWVDTLTVGRIGFAGVLSADQVDTYGLDLEDIAGILDDLTQP